MFILFNGPRITYNIKIFGKKAFFYNRLLIKCQIYFNLIKLTIPVVAKQQKAILT